VNKPYMHWHGPRKIASPYSVCSGPSRRVFSQPEWSRRIGWRTFFPLSFHGPIRGSVSCLPACPDHLPVVATGVRVGVRVTRRNRQHRNGWNTRVWGLRNSVDKKIIKFGDFAAVGTLHFDLAAKMVVAWQWVGPDHAEMMFAIRTHERIVAWHRNSCTVD
jgi:hypothetical protein